MRIATQATGTARKALVEDIAEHLETPARYLGLPTMAYEVGTARVYSDGAVELPGENPGLLAMLKARGWSPEVEDAGLTIELPREKVDAGNMAALLDAKGTLIKHALGLRSLPMVVGADKVSFPWYASIPEAEDRDAAIALICAMAAMSKRLKRVTCTAGEVGNEKYAFRCFLLRLGFIGDEKKAARRALLRRLEGSAAFKEPKEGKR